MSTVATPLSDLSVDVLLRDGRIAKVRLLRADDEAALLALHARVSLRTRMRRYFSASEAPGAWYVDKLVRSARGDCALVAIVQGEIVALAGYCRVERDPQLADLAMLVDDAHQSEGLGALLLEHLAVRARGQGIGAFSADVLTENAPMLHLLRDSGFKVTMTSSRGLSDVFVDLTEGQPLWDAVRSRDNAAQRSSLAPVLSPSSVAVVGSTREGSVAEQVREDLRSFSGTVTTVDSHSRLTATADLVVVAVAADKVLTVAADAAALGVKGLLVLSAGFAEAGPAGRALQDELLALCRRSGMRLLGPNCLGIVNTDPELRMNATFCDAAPQAGQVALISQSGAVGVAALRHAERTGVGLSLFVSTGNKADVSGNDLLAYLEGDSRTTVIGLYLESFGNAQRFARIAGAVGRSKPVVVLKSGRTAAGAKAGLSHTAAAASPDVAIDAIFRDAGVLRADDLPEMFDLLSVLSVAPLPRGPRVAVLGNSGGPGVLAADACSGAGLVVADLSEHTRDALRAMLPASAAVANPVDLLATVSAAVFAEALAIVLADPGVDAAVAIYTPVGRRSERAYAAAVTAASARFPDTPLVAVLPGVGLPPAELRDSEGALTVPFFEFPEPAVRALGKATAYATWRSAPPSIAAPSSPATGPTPALDLDPGWLAPVAVTALLERLGIPAARVIQAADAWAAGAAADALGYPVALKAAGSAVIHKADVGGVILGLESAEEVTAAFALMRARVGAAMTSAVVQRMHPTAGGLELIVGLTIDPSVGPLLLVGEGGTYTDLRDDRSVRVPPTSRLAAWEQLASLRCAPRFGGYRGDPPLDAEAVIDVLMAVAAMSRTHPQVCELDLNPLFVGPSSVCALDARIRIGASGPGLEQGARSLSA